MQPRALLLTAACLIACFFCSSCATTNWDQKKEQGMKIRTIGEVYLNQGNYRSALKELQRARQYYADDPLLHSDLGLTYYAMEQFDLAIRHFQIALALKPDFAEARNSLGKAYFKQQNYTKAIETFTDLKDDLLYATPHYPLYNLGEVYYEKKEYGQAAKYYRAALEIEPDFAFALQGLGKTYLASGNASAAIEPLEKAVASRPLYPAAYLALAEAHTRTGNYAEARQACQKVITLAPGSELATRAQKMKDRLPGQE